VEEHAAAADGVLERDLIAKVALGDLDGQAREIPSIAAWPDQHAHVMPGREQPSQHG
jgi:hypothetical protein